MASSAHDEMDDTRVAALDAFSSIQNPLNTDDSESPLETVYSGSSREGSSIPSDSDDNDWAKQLGWDWDKVSKDVMDSIDWKKSARNVKDDPNAPKPLRPPPQKDNFNGVFSYVEYIPAWTSPKFDPNKEYFGVEGQDEVTFQRWRSSFWARLRPAQAMLDSFYNPTAMAKRYGIYPNRQDGRSRLSPVDSVSRKVQLDRPISMPNGTSKTFVDMQFYKWVHDHEYLSQENAPNVAAGQSFERFLVERSRAGDNAQQQNYSEVYEKLLLLHKQILDDQEYQRAYFKEFTTDEHDDTVWAALQPALQVVTRFLEMDAPVFSSLMDYRSQRPVNQQVILNGLAVGWRERIAWFAHVDPSKTWECLAKLHDLGFNSVDWVQTILQERLELVVGSAYRDQDGRCSSRHFAWTNLEGVNYVANQFKTLSPSWRIRIEVAAEVMWPLLSADFTKAEKLTCSFAIAATIFHELAHAVSIALETMRCYPLLFSRKENEEDSRISREVHQQLEIAAQEMPGEGNEPFFEHQTEAEAGFAVENEVFGGTVFPIFHHSGSNTPDNFGILTTALSLASFPAPRPVEVNSFSINMMPDWVPPVLDIQTPIPYDMTARFFTQRFWAVDYKRFGVETLKLYPEGRITKSAAPQMGMNMVASLAQIFGKKRAEWMTRALRELNNRGFVTIADYLDEVCRQYVLPKVTRRNWYLESQRWPIDIARVQDCLDGVRVTGNNFLVTFTKLTGDEDQKRQDVRNLIAMAQQHGTAAPAVSFEACLGHYMEQLTRSTDRTFSAFLAWLKALERVMALRLQHSQFLIRSYLQLDISDRCTVTEGRGKLLRGHMRKMVTRPYNKVKICLMATVKFIQSRLDPGAANKYVEELEASYGHLMAIYQMTKETMDYLKPVNEHLNVGGAGVNLAYLPSSTFDPAARAERVRPLAMADLEFVKPDEVKQIVRVFETIFRAQDGKEILRKDQATLDDKLAELNNLLVAGSQDAGGDAQPRPPRDPRSGPGRGQRGAANIFNLSRKSRGSSRVTKQNTATPKKPQTTVSRLFNQNSGGNSRRTLHTFEKFTPLPPAPTSTASAQAASQFTQYAPANTTMRGFPTQTPGQPPAFAAAAPPGNPSNTTGQQQPQRFPLFPHPFADQTTIDYDLTPEERNWATQIAQAQLPNDMRSYREQIAEMLEFDSADAASALMAMASLGPPSQDGGVDNRRQALAVHAAVNQAVDATLPATDAAGPADLTSAAASMRPVKLLTATWAAAWTPRVAAADAAPVNVVDQLAEYATRRMVQEVSESQDQPAGQNDNGTAAAAAAANPQAVEVVSWTQLSNEDQIMSAIMHANDDDAMQVDDQHGEGQ
ncbi:hypothetical protein MCOR25_007943 [Pyricularia grisea]|nr:hypothetical protein MCOR25_007943 [Pyricularia grisea]